MTFCTFTFFHQYGIKTSIKWKGLRQEKDRRSRPESAKQHLLNECNNRSIMGKSEEKIIVKVQVSLHICSVICGNIWGPFALIPADVSVFLLLPVWRKIFRFSFTFLDLIAFLAF